MPAWLDRWLRPREGWLSAALLFVMLLALSWSVQKTAWLNQTEFLVPVAFYAVILGAVLGLTRWSVVFTLPVAAVSGAGIVLWTVGGEYFTNLGQVGRLIAMRHDVLDWFRILVDRGFPPQAIPYAVALAGLMWITAFIAAYTIYRHHRVIDAILLVGILLVANMTATLLDLLGYLVLFALAALLLWLRASLVNREEGWVRRRVTENVEVPTAIMRSGILFIAASITLAWTLTSVANAAPLQGAWNNLDGVWTNVRDTFDGLVGGLNNGDSRITGTTFGNSFRISGNWNSDDSPVMTVTADSGQYMRTKTYDVYTGHGWDQSDSSTRTVQADQPFFPGDTPERPVFQDSFVPITIAVQIDGSLGGNIFAPVGTSGGFPTSALAPVKIRELKGGAFLAGMQTAGGASEGEGYFITSLVSKATEAQLRAAGINYPDAVTALYLGTNGVTERTRQMAQEVVNAAGAETPYDMAKALATFLQRDPRFSYSTHVKIPTDPNEDLVDFFLSPQGQAGYCEFYATAMAVMARTLGIPARVAEGYAPGERIADGVYQVHASNAHAWAELYFPGYGWQIFEATKSIPSVVRLAGVDQPGASGGPPASIPPRFQEGENGQLPSNIPSFAPIGGGFTPGGEPPSGSTQGGNILVISFLILLVLLIAAWRLRRTRRSWRFLAPGARQWQRLAVAAGRAGIAQQPTETYFEYASWLEEQIPTRGTEIRTIAEGKVWESYSGRGMTSEIISRIEGAWKRLQLPFVWLALRRRLRSLLPRRR